MALLLNLVLFFLVAIFVGICLTAWRVYSSFRNLSERLRGGSHQQNGADRGSRSYGRTPDDEVIIDRRTPDEANRKIFTEGEGEYVDYVEEK